MNKKSNSPEKCEGDANTSHLGNIPSDLKAETAKTKKDPFLDLGDFVCEILTFSYSDAHRESLRRQAREMGGTLDQIIAAAIAQMISERFDVRYKTPSSLQDN